MNVNDLIDWVIAAPVWVQTPIVFAITLIGCSLVGISVYWVAWKIVPLSSEERRVLRPNDAAEGELS